MPRRWCVLNGADHRHARQDKETCVGLFPSFRRASNLCVGDARTKPLDNNTSYVSCICKWQNVVSNISKYYFLLCNIGCARIDKLDLCKQWILANHNNQYHGKSRHLQTRCYLILFAQNFGKKCGQTLLLLMQSCSSKTVSTLQKTGLTNHSLLLVRSGLGKGFTLDVITSGRPVYYIRPFLAWWQLKEQSNTQPGDPSASLLLTSEKAVSLLPFFLKRTFAFTWM